MFVSPYVRVLGPESEFSPRATNALDSWADSPAPAISSLVSHISSDLPFFFLSSRDLLPQRFPFPDRTGYWDLLSCSFNSFIVLNPNRQIRSAVHKHEDTTSLAWLCLYKIILSTESLAFRNSKWAPRVRLDGVPLLYQLQSEGWVEQLQHNS